jgi:hypothetical protein
VELESEATPETEVENGEQSFPFQEKWPRDRCYDFKNIFARKLAFLTLYVEIDLEARTSQDDDSVA